MSTPYHIPVLGREVCDALLLNPGGVYVDGTLGGGGHAEMILKRLEKEALYIGIDRDPEALVFAGRRLQRFDNFKAAQARFDRLGDVLSQAGLKSVDGILLDLGVSSRQIDEDTRGFAYRRGLKLDMRMDTKQDLTAEWIVNNYSAAELTRIFREYGEERFAGRIARKIEEARNKTPVTTSDQLIDIIDRCVNPRFAVKSYARIFQALRIAVNDELKALENLLEQGPDLLHKGGRLAVITYHSLEDRIVKQALQTMENPCICPPDFPQCVCGREPRMKRVKPFFILPGDEEIAQNPRARSAKLRVGEKI